MLFAGDPIELLQQRFARTQHDLTLLSAFATSDGVSQVLSDVPDGVSLTLVVRWTKQDLRLGASDIGVFDVVSRRGGRLFRNPNLHAKLFLMDKSEFIMGSANLTGRGLGLLEKGNNIECISQPSGATDEVLAKVLAAIRQSDIVDDAFVASIAEQLNDPRESEFGVDLDLCNATKPKGIFVFDLPYSASPRRFLSGVDMAEAMHDRVALGICPDARSLDELSQDFRNSHIAVWVMQTVQAPMSFGAFSSTLHNAMLDDPKPYRRDVKTLQVNLFSWIADLLQDSYRVYVPKGRHSQVIEPL